MLEVVEYRDGGIEYKLRPLQVAYICANHLEDDNGSDYMFWCMYWCSAAERTLCQHPLRVMNFARVHSSGHFHVLDPANRSGGDQQQKGEQRQQCGT